MNNAAPDTPAVTDWLWHALQRVPADQALLRAVEARLLSAAKLPVPCLDQRDAYGAGIALSADEPSAPHYRSAVLTLTPKTAAALPQQLHSVDRRLAIGATVAVYLPATADQLPEIAAAANRCGYLLTRWQPYFSAEIPNRFRPTRLPWPQRWHDLTGHYVPLPWQRFLAQPYANLQPLYAAECAGSDDGSCCFLLLHKAEQVPVEQELPAAQPLDLRNAREPVQPTEGTAIVVQDHSLHESHTVNTLNQSLRMANALPWLFAVASLLAALLAQRTMQVSPESPGRALRWWALALAALFGIGAVANPQGTRGERFARSLPPSANLHTSSPPCSTAADCCLALQPTP